MPILTPIQTKPIQYLTCFESRKRHWDNFGQIEIEFTWGWPKSWFFSFGSPPYSNDHDPEEVLVSGKLGHRWPGHGNSKLHPQVLIAAIEALTIINDLAYFICLFTFHFRFASLFPLNCFILHTSLYFVIAWPWTDVKSLCTFMTRKTFTILNLAPFGCISSI